MLELIVLGQVPGTGVVLTFSWVVALVTIIGGGGLLRHIRKQRDLHQQITIEETAL